MVSQRVVDALEVIDIAEGHRDDLVVPPLVGQRMRQPVDEQSSVGQTGQRVIQGSLLQALLRGSHLRYVFALTNNVERLATSVPHQAERDPNPHRGPLAVQVALFTFVVRDLTVHEALHEKSAGVDVVVMCDVDESEACQIFRRITEHGTEPRVRAENPAVQRHQEHADGCVVDGEPESLFGRGPLVSAPLPRQAEPLQADQASQDRRCGEAQHGPFDPVVPGDRGDHRIVRSGQNESPRRSHDRLCGHQLTIGSDAQAFRRSLTRQVPCHLACAGAVKHDRLTALVKDVAVCAIDRRDRDEAGERALPQCETGREHLPLTVVQRKGKLDDGPYGG